MYKFPTLFYSLLLRNSIIASLPLITLLSACSTGDIANGANPGVEEFPIAYIKRAIPLDDNGEITQPDLREPLQSMPGGDVYLKASSAISAVETNLTAALTNGMGDVRDLDVSYDGKQLLFSLLPEDPNPNDNDDPKWDIYLYDRETNLTTRVIVSDIIANEGDDISPHFLADGRIVFSSNRQSKSRAILLDEDLSKPQFSSNAEDNRSKAIVLHVMESDGSNIKQISFNQSHDLGATVLSDGRILFSRWDRMMSNDAISLYTILPDGSSLQPYFGIHDESHLDTDGNRIQFVQPRELMDGSIIALSQPYTDTFGGGELIIIDGVNFIDLNQATNRNQGALNNSAITQATITNVINTGEISIEGRYASVFPLNGDASRMLVSKGLCQLSIDLSTVPDVAQLETHPCIEPYLSNESATQSYPAYGIWLYDRANNTEKPIVIAQSGLIISNAVAMQPSTRPAINLGTNTSDLNAAFINENVGLLNIRSVYDFGHSIFNGCFLFLCSDSNASNLLALGDPMQATADQRPARFIRIVKAVGIPNRRDPDLTDPPNLSNRAFGRSRALGMKEIIGYSQIQPDGSVRVKVPADIAFYIEILDKNARRIGPRHENWLQVSQGDTFDCMGCHTHTTTDNAPPLPHARIDAQAVSINPGAPSDGYLYPNTLNPATNSAYFANAGDTMAEALDRAQAVQNVSTSITPSVNVEYLDYWTDADSRPADISFSYLYGGADGLTTSLPTSGACDTEWNARCRIVINYEEHIQPLWDADRSVNTCTHCHSPTNENGLAILPAAQLDLTSEVSDDQPQQITSYRELFFNDNFQDLLGTVLLDRLIDIPALDDNGEPILDNDGNPTFEQVPDPDLVLSPTMSINGARASFFIEKMTETELNAGRTLTPPTVNHANMLTASELRLISEWLDIGAQYFNNPFDPLAPEN